MNNINNMYWICKIKTEILSNDISLIELRKEVDAYIKTNQLNYDAIIGFFRVKNGKEFYVGKR